MLAHLEELTLRTEPLVTTAASPWARGRRCYCPSHHSLRQPILSQPGQEAPPWYYNKKRHPPSYGPDGKPRPRVNNVQLSPEAEEEEEEEAEEEACLLTSTAP